VSLFSAAGAAASGLVGRDSFPVRALRPAYELLLECASFGRGVAWSVNGAPVRIGARVRHLVAPVTEPEVFEFLRRDIRPGETVLDVGAFLGVYAVFAAQWVGPTGRVVAVEPTPANHRVIRRHARLNGVADRVTLVEAAVGAANGTATLFLHREPYVNRLGAPDRGGAPIGSTRIVVRTIDSLCAELGIVPDLIRMDIQGAELDALRGAGDVIRKGRGRLRMVVEMHPDAWHSMGTDRGAVADAIDGLGLDVRPLVPGADAFAQDGHALLVPR
jgi:FkbM family methyltransferase